MPVVLLPASAAAFAPRSSPTIVLASKAEPWLTQTLKRINRIKRPLNSVTQHNRCLTETLSGPNAIWTLCCIMLPKKPESEFLKDPNPLVEAIHNYTLLEVEGYVVHVDMVSEHEVVFKLTSETIERLVEYHKDVYSVDTSANTWNWLEKEVQLKKLQEDFVQAANKFVYRTDSRALEGLEEDGAGELLDGRSDAVKNAIMGLYLPLLPPPPRQPDVIRPAPILPSSTGPDNWWQTSISQSMPSESWKVVPSSPMSSCSADSNQHVWASMSLSELQTPSPASSFSQPDYSQLSYSQPAYTQSYTTACYSQPQYHTAPATYAPVPALPLPSMLAQQCSTSVGFGGFDWDHLQSFSMPYGTPI